MAVTIGVPAETFPGERRVAMTPRAMETLAKSKGDPSVLRALILPAAGEQWTGPQARWIVLQEQLRQLETKYGSQHPKVIEMRGEQHDLSFKFQVHPRQNPNYVSRGNCGKGFFWPNQRLHVSQLYFLKVLAEPSRAGVAIFSGRWLNPVLLEFAGNIFGRY